jgi:hypothetical protein
MPCWIKIIRYNNFLNCELYIFICDDLQNKV